nr:contractile injection system tape measure protein [Psychroserpens luteus]
MNTEGDINFKIYNAGLIILWPFLVSYFDRLSLIENAKFIDKESRNKAVYLLQYLVYNEVNFPEHELLLNKLLVGMSKKEHLTFIEDVSEQEKETSQSLLNGLISNWEKVRSSTPEAIQETFLQREGLLKLSEDKIVLKVEKKGVDILLDTISWSISIVKLPWMSRPIYIEWL